MAIQKFVYDEFGIVSADFVNIDLANDNRMFLNPYNIELLNDPFAIKATDTAVDFFECVRKELLAGNIRQAESIFCKYLTEPEETCLGYSEKGIKGRGIRELAKYVIDNIYYQNNHLINEIKRIEDINLYIDQIADDRVSDIYTNVIRGVLLEYTEQQCNLHGIPLKLMPSKPFWDISTSSWIRKDYPQFIWHGDKNAKLLIPKQFVKGTSYSCVKLSYKVILPELIEEELQVSDSSLKRYRKDGTVYIAKKDMRKKLELNGSILDKRFAREFAKYHQGCTDKLRAEMAKSGRGRK
ncbi:MAG: hypothetical protein K2L07_10550 [Lachnospiraceae bacterium]|nr:hypothetical protein [Lachnospiraceae bacterium]